MLSIITINKNNRAGLAKTIASLKTLASRDFQWVCIDGGSSDGADGLARAFMTAGDVFISEPDTGIYNAMNKGILHASGEDLLFLNSGDIFSPSLKSIASLSLDPKMDIHLFGFTVRGKTRLPRPQAWRFWSMPTSHQAIIYKKTLLLAQRFDENYRLAADFEHYLRISRLGSVRGQALRMRRDQTILIENEPYGTDAQLPRVLAEYRMALIQNGYPKIWAHAVFLLKSVYLQWALKR